MLNVILSHWAIYLYAVYVLVIVILCVVYRDRSVRVYRRIRHLPGEAQMLTAHWRPRTFR